MTLHREQDYEEYLNNPNNKEEDLIKVSEKVGTEM